jgi:hypothetical protein
MLNRKTLIALSLSLIIAACGGGGEAPKVPTAEPAGESMKDIGDHAVHFNAQLTDELSPEIARAYNIVRSRNRAMLTVSVVRDADGASVPAKVTVKTVNLTGQLKNVAMRPIEEQDAIYYIGETPVANRETLIFDISIMPEGAAGSAEVRFKREFYTD